MRRAVFSILLVANAILAGALWAAPQKKPVKLRGFKNCCESTALSDAYCCAGCCWFITNCQIDADCGDQ